MLTVACTLSALPFRDSVYNRSHVERLRSMIGQYLKQPYRFVCVDDSPFPGYWAKISLFEPGRFEGRVLYLDLDVTVIGSLDNLVGSPFPFMICRDWLRTKRPDGTIFQSRFNSSVMVWDAGVANHVYNEFEYPVMMRLPGDQDFISEQMPDAETFHADWCVSYKVSRYAKLKTMPKDARIICYHGNPKPWDLPDNDLQGFTFA